ncbi:nuclear transport factor 2 family protein [Entomomonas sp. E2T0]|uniref:YybH family protein n=1 Tax=Entomomonas sp. E2T0 TaxID=2930213 RepID=UPI00222821AF|nr:nuclear transport factor 2 family protein [Entomomonas sp. E2T0]UYZ83615.1 nuclear transport factor 2 family protein [Entomomonas sp. E2T0]
MKKIIAALLVLISFNIMAEEQDNAIHDELRQVLKTVTEAINTGDYDKMLPVLSKDMRATPVTQEFINGREAIIPYMRSWFGSDKFLKKLTIQFTPDQLTEISPDKTWGISYGSGHEQYTLSDGRIYNIKTRWTATVALEDGAWKIRTMHMGTDFLNNPILDEASAAINKMLIGGLAGGLILGLLLGFFIFRKKKV